MTSAVDLIGQGTVTLKSDLCIQTQYRARFLCFHGFLGTESIKTNFNHVIFLPMGDLRNQRFQGQNSGYLKN